VFSNNNNYHSIVVRSEKYQFDLPKYLGERLCICIGKMRILY